MKRFMMIALLATTVVGVAACSPKAQNETAEAADAIGADANATMAEAVNDTDAASDRAFGATENAMDAAGQKIGNVADAAENEVDSE